MSLAPGEGLALINSSAYGTGSRRWRWPTPRDCSMPRTSPARWRWRAFAANVSVLDPAITSVRPDPALVAHARAIPRPSRRQLRVAAGRGSQPAGPADLPQHGRDPGSRARGRAACTGAPRPGAQLRPGQPGRVSAADGRICLAAVYEVLGLAAALDYVRVVLASVFSSACERTVKLLDTPWSGLPTGLLPQGGPDLGLSIHAIARAVAGGGGKPAGPAGLVHRHEHGWRRGHRGSCDDAAAVGATAGRDDRSRRRHRGDRTAGCRAGRRRARVGADGRGHGRSAPAIRSVVPAMVAGEAPPVDVGPIRDLIRSGAIA